MSEIFDDNVIIVPPEENINERGYETTFYQDFSIADLFGEEAVTDTFNRAFDEWKSNYKYLTEFVIVLNHKIFDLYKVNTKLALLYDSLCKKAARYAEENLKGEELDYYYRETD